MIKICIGSECWLSGGNNSVGWTIWGFGIYFQYLCQVIKLTIVKNFKVSSLFSGLGSWFVFWLYWIWDRIYFIYSKSLQSIQWFYFFNNKGFSAYCGFYWWEIKSFFSLFLGFLLDFMRQNLVFTRVLWLTLN